MASMEIETVRTLSARDEKALLRSCWRKEAGAWERFLEQYAKLIYFSIHRTLSLRHYHTTPEEVEDLFHDVLVNLIKENCRKFRQYRGEEGCTVATWIRTITVRYVIDYLRQRARAGVPVEIEGEEVALEVSLTNPVTRPDEKYEEKEETRAMTAAVAELGDNDRYFIELYYKKGMGPEKVASVMGISVKTVYSRVNRIKAKLQESFGQSGRK